jgi:cytochrome c
MFLASLALALSVGGQAMAAPAPRPASFAMCAVCHKAVAGEKSMLGPNLFGVGGRQAGTLPGFTYSPAMKNSKIVWKRDVLVKFITDPRKSVPGTRMAFAGIKDPKKAGEVADYLLSLK